MIGANTSRGGASSMVVIGPIAQLMKTMQSQQNDYTEKAIQLKLEVRGKDYDWEVDAGLSDKQLDGSVVNEINTDFYQFLLSQDLDEMYVPPAVSSYLKLLMSYKQNNLITNRTGIYLEGYVNDIKIYKMPKEVFKDDFTCVCHTKHDEWVKAKIANVSRY
jgi:hypothetical protein